MLYLSGSMFKWGCGRLLLISLLINPILCDSILNAQDGNPGKDARAFRILEERGEIHIEFFEADISEVKKVNSFISVDRITANGYEAYANLEGFRSFLKLKIPYNIIEKVSGRKSSLGIGLFPGVWDVYPTYQQYISFMKDIARDYPGIARLDTIGVSVDGRQILYMKITDKPDEREPEPAFVYSSTMHGDEVTGYVLLMRLIDHLCQNYGKDSQVTRLVDSLEIWINPLANPDGTYWEGDDNLSMAKRFNSNNADLNRNFPGIKGSEHPDNMDYQLENLAQMDFLRNIYMVLGANIHGGEEVINYPFDSWKFLHADDKWYRGVSREYADQAQERSFPLLYMTGLDNGITNGWEWYSLEGGRQDWINYFMHSREVTIEISRLKDPPQEDLPSYWYYNYPSLLRYMEQSLYGIQGMIKDAENGQALKAGILVQGHDSLHSNIFSDSITGFFARPIEEGNFDIEVKLSGYKSEVIRGVVVEKDQTAWVEVNLMPLHNNQDNLKDYETIPPAYFSSYGMHITVTQPGRYRILLYDLKGSLVMEHLDYMGSPGTHTISIERAELRQGIYLLKIVSPEGILTQKIFR